LEQDQIPKGPWSGKRSQFYPTNGLRDALAALGSNDINITGAAIEVIHVDEINGADTDQVALDPSCADLSCPVSLLITTAAELANVRTLLRIHEKSRQMTLLYASYAFDLLANRPGYFSISIGKTKARLEKTQNIATPSIDVSNGTCVVELKE